MITQNNTPKGQNNTISDKNQEKHNFQEKCRERFGSV